MSDINTISETTQHTNGESPNGTAWTDSRDALKKIVTQVDDAVKGGVHSLHQVIHAELFSMLAETFSRAANAHNMLLEELKGEISEDKTIPWKKVLKYRRATQERVINPINARVGVKVAEQINKRFVKYFEDLQKVVTSLPDKQIIPEPPNLFQPREDDGLWIRIRKSHVRRSRAFAGLRRNVSNGFRHLLGREKISPNELVQHIDLRELLQYHIQMRIPELIVPRFNDTHRFLSLQIARYEKVQNDWSYELLEAEQHLAYAAHTVEELEAWIPPQEDESSSSANANLFDKLLSVASSFQSCLTEIAAAEAPEISLEAGQLQDADEALYIDFKSSDTFLLGDRSLPHDTYLPVSSIQRATNFWENWYREVNNRLQMNARLHELRDFLLRRQEGLLNSIAEATIIPILNSFSSLRNTFDHVSEETEKLCASVSAADTNEALLKGLAPLYDRLKQKFRYILNDVSDLLRAGQALEKPGAIFWNDLTRFIEDLPEVIDVHETSTQPVTRQQAQQKQYQVRLRELIQTALLVPLPRQLLKTAKALQKAVIQTWEETQQVEYMVDYNLKSAFEELEGPAEGEQPDTTSPELKEPQEKQDPVQATRELIVTGLSRSTEKLVDLAKELKRPWQAIVDQIFTSIQADSDDVLHDVRAADNMNDGWTNFKMKVNRFTQRLGDDLENRFEKLVTATGKLITNIRRRAKQLIKKGQTAVGVVDQSEDQWLATLELASDIDALHKKLPLVYRRLFSLKPLADLDLLEGRRLDVAFVTKHYGQWKKSQTGLLLLAMPDGSGRTSFMNVLSSSVFTDAEVKPLNLSSRVPDTQAFADLVAEALSLEVTKPFNLDDLEARIIEMDRGPEPCILVIDRFEHLLLCSPGGHDLIERVLIFMSRTDNLIYWVINVSDQAWHFLEKTMSPSSGFISAYKVTSLQRQALEDIILKRHHRSGMTLHFKPNTSTTSFFEFPRSNSEEAMQEMYRSAFFDRLHKLAGQNILLALLYWLRSVEFDAEKDILFVNSISPINFSFLDTLDLPRIFTLKSFLTHGTLTLEEHKRIFKLSHTESTFILESLLNLRIIEPNAQNLTEPISFRIEADQPYRLHPLIVHPVLELLKKQHIVY